MIFLFCRRLKFFCFIIEMDSYKSDADMVNSFTQTMVPESEGELEEIEDAEQNLTVENEESEAEPEEGEYAEQNLTEESEGEPQEDEDAEQNLTAENEGSDGEQEEVEEDDEQNGLAVEDEVIMELVECIRIVKAGLREQVFYSCIKLHKFESAKSTCTESKEHCCICLEDYSDGEELGKIDCGHIYHVDCIKEWVIRENTCPICKREVLARFSRFV